MFKFGKPSISMGHLYHGELLVITRLGKSETCGLTRVFLGISKSLNRLKIEGLEESTRPVVWGLGWGSCKPFLSVAPPSNYCILGLGLDMFFSANR